MKKIIPIAGLSLLLAIGLMSIMVWQSLQGVPANQLEQKYLTSADRFVDVQGARIRVRERGVVDAPVIVLVHGFTFSLESFDPWAERLAADYRVIQYDLLGHGLTGADPQTRYAPSERSAFLGDLLDALKIERASIAGNSLGGLVAWRFASHNPDRVERLILIDAPAFPFDGAGAEPQEIPVAVKTYFLTTPEAQVRQSLGAIFANPDAVSEERFDILYEMMRREGNPQAFVEHLEEFVMPDPTAELQKVSMPTLIMWGESDVVIALEQGEKMAEIIPAARLITYPGLGHVPHEEAPDATVRDAIAFLANKEPA